MINSRSRAAQSAPRPTALHYGVAVVAVGLALLLSFLAQPLIEQNPFLIFFAATALSAWYGGLGPGLLATALGAVAACYFFLPPTFSFDLAGLGILRLAAFVAVSVLISALSEVRRRREHAAYTQREQLRVTLASIGDGVIATDTEGRVTFLNPVAAALTGWQQEAAVGQPVEAVFRIVNADTRATVESPIAKVLREGVVVGLANHTILLSRDGVERPIDDSGAPIRNSRGNLSGVVLVFRDVTERALAETARAELLAREQAARGEAERERERMAFLADSSRLLASSLDYATTLQQVANLAVPRLADWCVVDLPSEAGDIEMVAAAHVDPDKVRWAHELRKAYPVDPAAPVGPPHVIRTGEPQIFPDIPDSLLESVARTPEELRILRAVGYRSAMVVPLRARGVVLGALTLVIAESERRFTSSDLAFAQELADRAAVAIDNARLYQDVQEAHGIAEDALEQLGRLQLVTASLGAATTPEQVADVVAEEGLAAVDADAGAVFVLTDDGRAWEALSFRGYPAELAPRHVRSPVDVPGPLYDALHTRSLVAVETPEEMLGRWPHLAEAQAQSGDAASVAVPLLLGEQILGVLYVAFRAPCRFSEDDRSFMTSLGRQCAQALDRARLYAAEQAARSAAEAALSHRDVFLSVAAHELKTPLTALMGQAQLLQRRAARDGHLSERDQRTVSIIAAQTQRLDLLVQALLDISRLEHGRLTIERASLDLRDLVGRVVDEIQPTLERHALAYAADEAPLWIDGDALRLEQVLHNLVGNAVKYSPEGGTVSVRLERRGDRAVVTIADQGIGIPRDAIPHLFQRFFRAGNVDPRHISGMGIGLYVVREIVALHGGTVSVESADGRGSTFAVSLPALEAEAQVERGRE